MLFQPLGRHRRGACVSYHTRPDCTALLFSHTSVLGVFHSYVIKCGKWAVVLFLFFQLNAAKFKYVDMYFVVKNISRRLERLSSYEHCLLLQRTQIPFPASMLVRLKPLVTPVPGRLTHLCALKVHIPTFRYIEIHII